MTDASIGIGADPAEIARRLSEFSARELEELLTGPSGGAVLDEVFRQMRDHFRPELAKDADAFVSFVLTGGPDGSTTTYGLRVRDGACTLSSETGTDAAKTLTVTMDRVQFIRVLTGQVSGAKLYLQRKVKISGDLKFGGRVISWFGVQPEQDR
jgi:alkyl sulfatase BDS1-like metallo-beta-lactamase superfamily hydrolase